MVLLAHQTEHTYSEQEHFLHTLYTLHQSGGRFDIDGLPLPMGKTAMLSSAEAVIRHWWLL